METKACTRCGDEVKLNMWDSKMYMCIHCRRKYANEYRKANRDKINSYARAYRKERMKDPEYRARINAKNRAFAKKKYRTNEEYRVKVLHNSAEYESAYPDKAKARKKRCAKEKATQLSDSYIKNLLTNRGFSESQKTPEIIKAQRALIKAKRTIKEIENG